MKIHGFHIDGFGRFHDQRISGLGGRLVVFQGENEAGKSTLLGFIRAMFFGFPRANARELSYPPLAGGTLGGRLDLETRSGEFFSVSRKKGAGDGALAVTGKDGALYDKAMLDKLLGGISAEAYRHIMAFGLSELAGMETLSGDHISGAIYGAGGSSMAALPAALKTLRERKEKIFKPRGKQPANLLAEKLEQVRKALAEAASQQGRYDGLIEALAATDRDLEAGREALSRLRREADRYGAFEKLWEDWLLFSESRRELADLPDRSFPEEGLQALASLQAAEAREREALAAFEADIRRISDRMVGLPVDEKILSQAQEISVFAGQRSRYEDQTQKLPLAARETRDLEEEAGRLIARLGSGWDEAAVINFDQSLFTRDTIRQYQHLMDTLERDIGALSPLLADKAAVAEVAREAVTRMKAEDGGEVPGEPFLLKWAWPGLLVAGFLAGGLFFYFDAPERAAFFFGLGVVLTWGVWVSRGQRRKMAQHDRNQFRKQLEEKQTAEETARKGFEKIQADQKLLAERLAIDAANWGERCRELGFAGFITPATALEVIDTIARAGETLRKRDQARAELARIQSDLEVFRERALSLLAQVGLPTPSEEGLSGAVAELASTLEESKLNGREKETLTRQLAELSRDKTLVEEKRVDTLAALRGLMARAKAPDETVFRRMGEEDRRRRELLAFVKTAEGNMRRISGAAELEGLLTTLSSLSLEEVLTKKDEALREVQALEEETARQYDGRARLKQELDALSLAEETIRLRADEAGILADLEENARQWAVCSIAEHLIQTAREVFEKKHQPGIIRDAGDFFSRMTGGKYRIFSPLGEKALSAITEGGERLSPENLSRGTAEQLYLAVRFGFIRHQAENSEPLPVVMDDILVNFDPARMKAAAEAIVELAATHQVLYFTCHPGTVALFRSVDGDVPVVRLAAGRIMASGEAA